MGRANFSQIVALLTFPGVVVHEVAELLFCRWLGVAVLDVCYFRFGNPAGYVIPEPSLGVRELLWIGLGPLFVNSLLGALIAFPSVFPALEFGTSSVGGYILAWLGISIVTQALPSAETANALWHALRLHKTSLWMRWLATPLVRFICLVTSGRFVGADLVYGVAVVAAPPAALWFLLR